MQLAYNQNYPMGRAGMRATLDPVAINSRIAEGTIAQGRGAFRVPSVTGAPATGPNPFPGAVWQNPNVAAAANVNAIATTVTGADAGKTIVAADFNGALGAGTVQPPRPITVTTNSHADWDAATGGLVITYINYLGVQVSETFNVTDAGNQTFTTAQAAMRPVSVAFNATSMAGVGATFTVGYAALDASIVITDFMGIVLLDTATIESTSYAIGGTAPVIADPVYADGATVPLMQMGTVWVNTEDACTERGAVYVRIAPSGANTRIGSFRSDADSGNAILVPSARYDRDSLAAGLNIIAIGY
jgi:hypothetical protein